MPVFEYEAIDNEKDVRTKGSIETLDREMAEGEIAEMGMTLISLEEKKKSKDIAELLPFLNKVSKKDLVVFSRQFSVLLKANVPVVQSIRILIRQTKNPKLKAVLSEVTDEVDGGMRLSESLGRHAKIFGDFFIAMIESGETSGRLDEVLEYLADQQEKDYDLMSKIKGAMTYPIFIVCGLFVVGIIMMIVVIPKLTDILKETGGELPMSTKILIGASDFMSGYWWLLLILIGFLVFGMGRIIKTPWGRIYWNWLLIKIPVFGKLFQRIYLVRMTRSLATLSTGGIPLVEALKITSQVVGNKVYRDIIDETIDQVEEGSTIGSVFVTKKEVPAMVSYMISVGEQTGKLDLVLEKLSDFYAREIDNMVANMVSLIEPLIMVILGVAVGTMVAAIIMPMYNLASSF